MAQLIVNVNRLNRRSKIPGSFPDKLNILGTVVKGFRFESVEETTNVLGKWYRDRDNAYYWSGGVTVLDAPPTISIKVQDLPVNLPDEYNVGIDISHHNGTINWGAVKTAGISFVYIKISEGVGTPDPMAKTNAETAKKLGFKIGYYHFCHPDMRNGGTVISDAIAETDEAMNLLKTLRTPDLPLVLDLENENMPLSESDFLRWIDTFINHVVNKTGIEPMIYSGKAYLDSHLPPDHTIGKCKLWLPRYGLNDTNKLQLPVGWNDWTMWQYTEHGKIEGNSDFDINILKDKSLF
ncbi:MAG: glycoside hydrolase family 25 protein [Ginsengibacter sp.]